jgi:hypothetical protein
MRLLRTLVIAVVICGLLLVAALPALAAGPGTGDRGRWWEGKVEVVRGQASVNAGSPPSGATGVINVNSKTIYVTANTTYKVPGLKTADISDIDGKYIVAQCDIAATWLWARHVIVVPGRLEGGEPEYGYKHYTGNVTTSDYDPNMGGTITIQDKSGNLIPFQINAGNFRIVPSGATVAAGEWVTVIGYGESASTQLMALGVRKYLQRSPSLSREGPSHAGWTEARRAARDRERTVPERWR